QPAEGRAGEMAGHLAAGGAARRADPRHRRRGEDRGLSTHPEARRRRCGHRARLQRTPRGPGHVRSAPRHVRRPDRRAAAAECERGRGARTRDRNRGPGGGGAMRQRLRRLDTTALVYIALVLVLIVGAVLVATTGRSFFSAGNIRDILTGMSVLGFVAIGQTLVILGASLDVSAAIGAANGVFVTVLKVHGFVATLGMGLMLKGYLDTNYQGTEGSVPWSFQLFGATGIGPVPISTLLMLALAGLVAFVLAR